MIIHIAVGSRGYRIEQNEKSGTLFPFSPTFVDQTLCIKHIPQHAKSRLNTGPSWDLTRQSWPRLTWPRPTWLKADLTRIHLKVSWHILFSLFMCFHWWAKLIYTSLTHMRISELSTGKPVNLNKSYHQHFFRRDGNQQGKNKEQINSPPYLHAILLFPNYIHVQNPIFHSTQYFPDSHCTL